MEPKIISKLEDNGTATFIVVSQDKLQIEYKDSISAEIVSANSDEAVLEEMKQRYASHLAHLKAAESMPVDDINEES